MTRDEVLELLRQYFSAEELGKWSSSLGLSVDNGVLTVRFPHRFFADWFEKHARSRFEKALAGTGLQVVYQGSDGRLDSCPVCPLPASTPYGREFVFDNFLANDKNKFPLASAREVAHSQEAAYNPFVLCGESGSGKSFLLRSIANARSQADADAGYVGSIEDLHELFTSRSDARAMLMGKEFLAIDDLQDLARYQYLQGELLVLFDHFHLQRKQMIFACNSKIAACAFMQGKLKSRLEWGLTVLVKQPDMDIRNQYVASRCRERGLELPKDKELLLAQRFTDLRNLEGCLLKLWAYRELVNDQISDDEFDNILNYLEDRSATSMTVEQVIGVVCAHFRVEPEDVLSARRKQEIVLARQVAMFLARRHLGMSYPELGRAFGGKDHSTVLYGCRKVEQLQRDDKKLKSVLQTLTEKCLSLNETGLA